MLSCGSATGGLQAISVPVFPSLGFPAPLCCVTSALDYILKALKLCDIDDQLCARIHSDHGDILKDLGDLSSSAQSDYAGAFRHYQVALSLDPKNKLIIDNMAKLRRRITRPLPFHDCV
ncbi:hypothetical protein MTO96_033615 [Rhipicephalus appendiculatus]